MSISRARSSSAARRRISQINEKSSISLKRYSSAASRPLFSTGGNEIKNVGGFRYHMFQSTGTFTPDVSGNYSVILIGGGAPGSGYVGGGGGQVSPQSGYNSVFLVGGIPYTVTVGSVSASTLFAGLAARGASGGTSGSLRPAGSSVTGRNWYGGGGVPREAAIGSGGGGGGSQIANGGNASNNGAYVGIGGTGATGQPLVSMDSNFTAANFSTFTGMTVVSSGGGGGAGWASPGNTYFDPTGGELQPNYIPGTPGAGGTGAGSGSTHGTTYSGAPPATPGFSWGSGGGVS